MTDEYWYEGALIYYDEGWYADCYPYRHRHEPTTILGPFTTKQQAEAAVDKAP